MRKLYGNLQKLLGEKTNSRMAALIILPIIGSLFETFGISAIVSFITVILDETALETNRYVKWLYYSFHFENYQHFIIVVAWLLVVFYIIKTLYLSAAYQLQNTIVRNAKKEISSKIFRQILGKPYEYFTNVNAAEVTRIVNNDIMRCMDFVMLVVQMFTEIMVIVLLLVMLLMQDASMTLFIGSFLIIGVGVIRLVTKRKVSYAGTINQELMKDKTKWVNQAVYGIKDIKISQNKSYFEKCFDDTNGKMLKYELQYSFWMKIPQYLIEMIIMICVLLYIIVAIMRGAGLTELIPVMSAFALAAVRLLPACNRISSYMTQLTYRKPSVKVVLGLLKEQLPEERIHGKQKIAIEDGIELEDVSFAYSDTEEYLFQNVHMSVKAGQAVGVIGPSGAGKTTTVDILLGLLKPQNGAVYADGINIEEGYESYLSKISYIPQSIFLTDDSIRNNVAFGVEENEIDDSKVWKALEEAQLADYVRSLPKGIDTEVGEQGVRISGGQKQRIGIARALYKEPSVLVLDEATSALDNETEAAIMESVHHLKGKKTMIIIAHRISTIRDCDIIYQVKDGKIEETEINEP
jgi:ABC-type multidrug transport system fused ATPase/permease subunit